MHIQAIAHLTMAENADVEMDDAVMYWDVTFNSEDTKLYYSDNEPVDMNREVLYYQSGPNVPVN